MKFFFSIPVLGLLAAVPAPGDEAPPEKTVSVALLSAASEVSWEPGIKKPEKMFHVTVDFTVSNLIKIIGCRKEDIRLEVRDSTGTGGVPSRYKHSLNSREPQFCMEMKHWVPSATARWVSVKGSVPLLVAEKEATSEGLLFCMDKKEEEQTLVLKVGGLMDDGRQGDVKTTLKMKWSLDEDSGKIDLKVALSSPRILGISGVTLKKPDGSPVVGNNWGGEPSVESGGSCSWEWNYNLEPDEQGEIKVFVNYMTELKQVDVPIDLKFGLSGMMQETPRQQER